MKATQKGITVPLVAGIIIVLLSIAGYAYMKNDNAIPATPQQQTASTTVGATDQNDARASVVGITVDSPQSGDLVKLPITIMGAINGNGWFANEGEVGVVEVFDANGKSISNREIVRATTDWLTLPTRFTAVVGDREMMAYLATDTGVIRITGTAAKNGEQTPTIEIPVRFK